MIDPHDTDNGGHAPVDVDPFIPTGRCAICGGLNVDERIPEDRGPDNPYDSGIDESGQDPAIPPAESEE